MLLELDGVFWQKTGSSEVSGNILGVLPGAACCAAQAQQSAKGEERKLLCQSKRQTE